MFYLHRLLCILSLPSQTPPLSSSPDARSDPVWVESRALLCAESGIWVLLTLEEFVGFWELEQPPNSYFIWNLLEFFITTLHGRRHWDTGWMYPLKKKKISVAEHFSVLLEVLREWITLWGWLPGQCVHVPTYTCICTLVPVRVYTKVYSYVYVHTHALMWLPHFLTPNNSSLFANTKSHFYEKLKNKHYNQRGITNNFYVWIKLLNAFLFLSR